MTPAADPDWAAEDAAYWRAHRPAYLPQQRRTQPLPPSPFPLGVRFAVGPTAAPLPPIVAPPPPPPLETLLEPPPARWVCAECGGPRRTARSTKCQTCTAKAANAVRWPKGVPPPPADLATPALEPDDVQMVEEPPPAPGVCPDCGTPTTRGRRCSACKMQRFWAGPPRALAPAPRTCVDCGDRVSRASVRCRQCGQRARFAAHPRPAAPQAYCPDCGDPVTKPGSRCRPCAGVARYGPPRPPAPIAAALAADRVCPECRQPSTTGNRCRRCSHGAQAAAARVRHAVAAPAPPSPTLDRLVAGLARANRLRAALSSQLPALDAEIATLETEIARRQAARNLPAVPHG